MYPFNYIPKEIEETEDGEAKIFHFRNSFGALVIENHDNTFDIYLIWFVTEDNYFYITEENKKYVSKDIPIGKVNTILGTISKLKEVDV